MWKRMFEPWVIWISLADLTFSIIAAHGLVRGLGWRYTDLAGISTQAFNASNSIIAYTFFGSVIWPVVALLLWLIVADFRHAMKRRKVRYGQSSRGINS